VQQRVAHSLPEPSSKALDFRAVPEFSSNRFGSRPARLAIQRVLEGHGYELTGRDTIDAWRQSRLHLDQLATVRTIGYY
jgi:hypothetical protein